MAHLSVSEILFYGGIIALVLAGVLGAVCIGIFIYSGRKLKKRLEQEYGKPRR